MKRRGFLGAGLGLAAFSLAGGAGAGDLPPRNQALLILRTLAYDRRLKDRAGATVEILVVFQPGNQPSEAVKGDIVGALEDAARSTSVSGLPVHVSSASYSDAGGLEAAIKSSHACAVYVCLGLAPRAEAIAQVTRRNSALTFTGDENSVKSQLSIGLFTRGTKPTVLVNLPASKAEGANLDPALLRVAEVIK